MGGQTHTGGLAGKERKKVPTHFTHTFKTQHAASFLDLPKKRFGGKPYLDFQGGPLLPLPEMIPEKYLVRQGGG